MSLNNLGNRLAETGDKQAALAPVDEAVTIRRTLAETDPTTYLSDLAISLNNLGIRLAETGDKQAALAPANEAVTIRRTLAETDPTTHLPNLAASLNNLSNRLAETGDKQAALAPANEATKHYRTLAETDPAAYLPDLAMSLWALAWGQACDSPGESMALADARVSVDEACAIYEKLANDWPRLFDGLLHAAQVTRTTVLSLIAQREAEG
ncbi:tetratricopeptide repeat protein [Actinophytocola sediminis]